MDPDLAKGNKQPYFPQAADVWALGAILFILLTSQFPFNAEFEADLFRKVMNAKYQFPEYKNIHVPDHKGVSEAAKSLIRKIFTINPKLRITAGEILKDPWVTG